MCVHRGDIRWVSIADAQTVDAGRQVFASRCAACHGTEGNGGELGPAIAARVPLRSDADLEVLLREGLPGAGMPAFQNLSPTETTNLIAFLRTLRPRNNAVAVQTSVTLTDGRKLRGVILNQAAGEMQLLGDDRKVHLLRASGTGHREVTSQSDWPTYNGHVSGNRYSPLTQIDAGNANRLVPKWIFSLPNSAQLQVTPVVVGGVMYVSSANDVYALDAGSGRQIWNYRQAAHARHRGCRRARCQSWRRRGRRSRLRGNRPRPPHRPQSRHRCVALGNRDGRLAPELQRHGCANGGRRSRRSRASPGATKVCADSSRPSISAPARRSGASGRCRRAASRARKPGRAAPSIIRAPPRG